MTVEQLSRFWAKVEKTDSCWIALGFRMPNGYVQIGLNNKRCYMHRASWMIHFGAIPDGLFVCHKCDVPWCVNPEHLFLGTHLENIADMVWKGRQAHVRGAMSGKTHLTEADVAAIRQSTLSAGKLCVLYGVHRGAISKILAGSRWGHISPPKREAAL